MARKPRCRWGGRRRGLDAYQSRKPKKDFFNHSPVEKGGGGGRPVGYMATTGGENCFNPCRVWRGRGGGLGKKKGKKKPFCKEE